MDPLTVEAALARPLLAQGDDPFALAAAAEGPAASGSAE